MARTPDIEVFLRKLDQLGGSSGNTALMRDLGWASERYWRVRDELLDEGLVVKGRGKGGSVQSNRPVQAAPRSAEPRRAVQIEPEVRSGAEVDLYEPFARVLRGEWARERRLSRVEVQVTAFGGKKSTGGTWTRPDITVVSRKEFTLVPSQFDVWTFELKPIAGISVKAVFEALSHARRATRSVVAFEVPEDPDERTQAVLKRCEEEAERHNLSFIKFTDPGDFETWDMVDAERQDTDGELLEDFLLEQLSEEARTRIRGWG